MGSGPAEFHSTAKDLYRQVYFEVFDLAVATITSRFDQSLLQHWTGEGLLRTTPKGAQRPRESADISVKPLARPCYNIYVTLSIVVYSTARNYLGITTL